MGIMKKTFKYVILVTSYSFILFLFNSYTFADNNGNKHATLPSSIEDKEHRISKWISDYYLLALEKRIIANINGFTQILTGSPMDHDPWGLPGNVIAAPSVEFDRERRNPATGEMGEWQDYRGVWKRDSSITMRMIFRLMNHGPWRDWPAHKKLYVIRNYVNFSEFEQGTHRVRPPIDWGGPGDEHMVNYPLQEPQFDLSRAKVNPFNQENVRMWGEPQDDGPPLQTITLIEGLKVLTLLSSNEMPFAQDVINSLYRVIRRNLRFMMSTIPSALNLQRTHYERWEETAAQMHFAILMEQRYALHQVKYVLLKNSDADRFRAFLGYSVKNIDQVIEKIELRIQQLFLSKEKGHILSHYHIDTKQGLVRSKDTNLDVQVLMASLETNKFGGNDDNFFFAPSDPWMRATFYYLEQAFQKKYKINKDGFDHQTGEKLKGTVWGRYPEDNQHFNGDPWFISTYTKVQFLLWDAVYASKKKEIQITPKDKNYFLNLTELKEEDLIFSNPGDVIIIKETDPRFEIIIKGLINETKETFFRAMTHAGDGGELSEVIDQNTGKSRGIRNLTWSWVELLKSIRMLKRSADEPIIQKHLKLEIPESACDLALEGMMDQNHFESLFSL